MSSVNQDPGRGQSSVGRNTVIIAFMEESNQQDNKNNQTFRRSRHGLSPAVMFYVRWMVLSLFLMLLIVIINLFSGYDVDHLFGGLLFFACFSVF